MNREPLAVSDMKARIDRAWSALARIAQTVDSRTDHLTLAVIAARKSEKAHRDMGARFCRARYRLPVQRTERYFTIRWFLDPMPAPKTWRDAFAIREDAAHASALREEYEAHIRAYPDERLAELFATVRDAGVLEIDYADDIAHG